MKSSTGVKVGIVVVGVLAIIGGLFFALGSEEATAPGSDAAPALALEPASGPSGTEADLTFTGGTPGTEYSIVYFAGGEKSAVADDKGNFVFEDAKFEGKPGDVIEVEIVATGNVFVVAANFTITETPPPPPPTEVPETTTAPSTTTTSTIPDAGPAKPEFTVTLKPSKGPGGFYRDGIEVVGPDGLPVTVVVGVDPKDVKPPEDSGSSGALLVDGKYVIDVTYTGKPEERVPVTVIVGLSGNEATQTVYFEITRATISGGPYIFSSSFSVFSDVGRHRGVIGMPDQLDLEVKVASITVTGPSPFVAVTGELPEDGAFDVDGSGTVAGINDVSVRFVGRIDAEELSGQYSMGVNGELPGGEAIIFDVASTSVIPPGADPVELRDFDDFYQQLSTAQATGDIAFLSSTLHPAVIDRYGQEACDDYLVSIVNPDVSIVFVELISEGEFFYETDGMAVTIPSAYKLNVLVTVGDDQQNAETHVATGADGELLWFTDCGTPADL